jgi:hypothetical protein
MKSKLSILAGAAALAFAGQAAAQVTFYEHPEFRGRAFTVSENTGDLGRFSDRASSAIVERGRWLVCHDPGFHGQCSVLRPGQYVSLRDMGFEDSISSVRRLGGRQGGRDDRYDRYEEAPVPPPPQAAYEWRQRPNERVFEVPVMSAVAVVGPPEQRCWTERERVSEAPRETSVPGAIIGGIVGGILGTRSAAAAATRWRRSVAPSAGPPSGRTPGGSRTGSPAARCSVARTSPPRGPTTTT